MLFPTAVFTFGFLPIVLAAFFLIGMRSHHAAAAWLFLASLFFYGYWMPEFTLLLVVSIVVNFRIGTLISRRVATRADGDRRRAKALLIGGVVLNLAALAYFKYANFFVDSLNTVLPHHLDIARVVLPVGISFYTFTQIAFLADAFSKGLSEYRFAHYGLFVTYFPHLIAGPVLHHAQMMPQFGAASTYKPSSVNIAAGLAIFGLGLFKKVVLADGVAPYADTVFAAADGRAIPNFSEAWIGALAYTFQIYFDFSGYSDMAIGLSLLFNVRLPLNFDSPYKSANIVEFWRRWHMSLSTFLRDYLYIPLGGNRHGGARRHLNLMLTMLLGGLWHGANWTFVFWGALHGAYLVVNHAVGTWLDRWAPALRKHVVWRVWAVVVTFLCVVVAWLFFRAHTFAGATTMLQSMLAVHDYRPPSVAHPLLWNAGLDPLRGWGWCAALGFIAMACPNSNSIGDRLQRRIELARPLRFVVAGGSLALIVFLVVMNEARDAVSAFIYFNF
jgi:alginate O-acetyltransferase complex protein AlgI